MYQDETLDEGWQHRYEETRSEDAQERAIVLQTLCRTYEQADRVLSGDPIIVNVVPDGPAAAWSDGASITLNASEINDIDLETLTQINGLNYHELSHHLYTPRSGTDFIKWVVQNGYMVSANMLEDQRIETLIVARWPSVTPYLTATVARWLGNTPEEMTANYMLVRGRRYLPVEIRQEFRDLFSHPQLIPAIIDIVDEYRLLAFPRDYARGKELIKRFNDEVIGNFDMDTPLPKGPNGCSNRDPMKKGRPEPGKAQEKDAQRAGGMGKAESDYVPVDSDEAANPANFDATASKADADPNTNNTRHTPQTAQQALDMREAIKNVNAPSSVGSGHHDSLGGIPASLNDMLEKAISDVMARKDVIADVKTKQKVIVGGDGDYTDSVRKGKFDNTPVPAQAMQTYRRFARELERLRDECEPGWVRETPSGRLNVQRVLRGCEIDEAFDSWDEGTDGADLEAVILVDRSGSMSGSNDRDASIACWTIKRGLEQIGAPVTVYAFDDRAEVAYTRKELTNKTNYKFIFGNGGTDPYTSLLAAEQLLMASRKKNKMLFIVTDGVFDAEKNDEIISRISKRGILTAMTLIMSDRDIAYYEARGDSMKEFSHGAEVFGRISNATDLVPFAKTVVSGAIKKRGR